jgi:hypothetical protein
MPKQDAPLKEVLSIRLDPAAMEALERRASEQNVTPSDWCRRTLARALDYDPSLMLLLREILAVRLEARLLVRLVRGEELSSERLNFLLKDTDEKKYSLAEKLLAKDRTAARKLPPDLLEEPSEPEPAEPDKVEPEKPTSRRAEEARALAAMRKR